MYIKNRDGTITDIPSNVKEGFKIDQDASNSENIYAWIIIALIAIIIILAIY